MDLPTDHTGSAGAAAPRLEYPCDYPIKVMARRGAEVRSHLDVIVETHAGPLDLSRIIERASAQNNFVGVTYFIQAQSPEHIATLFEALKQCPHVMLVL